MFSNECWYLLAQVLRPFHIQVPHVPASTQSFSARATAVHMLSYYHLQTPPVTSAKYGVRHRSSYSQNRSSLLVSPLNLS